MTWLRFSQKRGRISKDPLQAPDALARLLDELSRRWNTPDLIAYAADEQTRLLLLKALVSPASEADQQLARRAGEILRRRGRDPQKLRERLEPAAYALGMVSACDVPLDHYELLGVSPSATPQEIRAAYRKKAFERHPDTARARGGDPADFVHLQAAYDTLMNPQNRAAYDGCRNHLGMWREEGRLNRAAAEDRGMPGRARWVGYRVAAIGGVLIIAAWVTSIAFEEWAMVETVQETLSPAPDPGGVTDTPAGGPGIRFETAPAISGAVKNHKPRSADETAEVDMEPTVSAEAPEAPVEAEGSDPLVPMAETDPTAQDPRPAMAALGAGEAGIEPSTREKGVARRLDRETQAPAKAPVKTAKQPEVAPVGKDQGTPAKSQNKEPMRVAAAKKATPMRTPDPAETKTPSLKDGPHLETPDRAARPAAQVEREKPAAAEKEVTARKRPNRLADITGPTESPRSVLLKNTKPKPTPVDRAQVLAFINRYTRAYENGAAETFFSLFTKDATENGTPVEVLKPQYREIWDRMKTLNYQIEVAGLDQVPEKGRLAVEGRFTLWWDGVDQSWGKSRGAIYMTLDETKKGLRVRQLRYRFD